MKKVAILSLKEFWSKIPRSINTLFDQIDFTKPIKYQADLVTKLISFFTNLNEQLVYTYRVKSTSHSILEIIEGAEDILFFLEKNKDVKNTISYQQGLSSVYSRLDQKCDHFVISFSNYVNNMPIDVSNDQNIDPVFKEFDFHGIKFIAQVDISPNLIFKCIKDIEAAYEFLKLKKLDVVWRSNIFLANPDRADVAGSYYGHEDIIKLYSPVNATYTILHELGHRYWFKYMTKSQRIKFKNFTKVLSDRDTDKPIVPEATSNLRALFHVLHELKNSISTNYDIILYIISHDYKGLEGFLNRLFEKFKQKIPASSGIEFDLGDFMKDFINYVKSVEKDSDDVVPKSMSYIKAYIDGLWSQVVEDIGPTAYNEANRVQPVTEYGETNQSESFAELFTEYVMGKHDHLDRANAELFRSVMNLHENVVAKNLIDMVDYFYKQSSMLK